MPYDSLLENMGSLAYVVGEGETAPKLGDGVNYSRALGWQSPEGNFYGHERFVRDWRAPVIWDGSDYRILDMVGEAASFEALPSGPRPYMEVWGVKKDPWPPVGQVVYINKPYDLYFYDTDTESWKQVVWYYDVDGDNGLPHPGLGLGAAHVVIYADIKVFWDGYVWRRFRHSSIENDEPEIHLPYGFLEFLTPDVILNFFSKKELGLLPAQGGSGVVLINNESVAADYDVNVYSATPSLEVVNGGFITALVDDNAVYWVYLANSDDSFIVEEVDFRKKLFISKTVPNGNRLSGSVGINTVLVGQITTDSEGFFRHDLDISWISRRASIQETFRDYSDFFINYIGPDEISFERMTGYYGQMYVPEELVYFGSSESILRTDPWISVDPDTLIPSFMDVPLIANSEYFIYLINEVDAVNFNAVNSDTGRPWQAGDYGAATNYDVRKDLRLMPVLCDRPHTDFRLTTTWPLFYSRCIGHVWTDANSRLLYAKDISYIKSLILNPTHFKGQADYDVRIPTNSGTAFGITETPGTAGVVYVGGETVKVAPVGSENVHTFDVNQYIQIYTEANVSSPLSAAATTVIQNPSTIFYIYMANSDTCWGDYALALFASTLAPTRGYLSINYPGTAARWIATVRTDAAGKLTGVWLLDAPGSTTEVYGNVATQAGNINSLQSNQISALSAHNSLVDFLMGIESGFFIDMEAVNSDLSALGSDLEDLSGNMSDAVSNLGLVGSAADQVGSYVSDLRSDVSALSGYVSGLGSNLNAAQSDVNEIYSDIDDLYSDVSGAYDNISDMGSNFNDISDNVSDIQSNVGDINSDVSAARSYTSALYSIISDFSGELYSAASFLSDANSLMSNAVWSDVSGIYSELGNLSHGFDMLGSADTQISNNTSLLVSTLRSETTSNFNAVSLRVNSLSANLSATISDLNILSGNISATGSNFNTLSGQLSGLGVNFNNISLHYNSLNSDVSNVFSAASNVNSHISSIYSDLSLHSTDLWRIYSDLSDVSEDMGSLYSNLSRVQSDTGVMSLDIVSLFSSTSGLSNTLSNLRSNISAMSGDVSNLYSDFSTISLTYSALSGNVSGLGSNINKLSNYTISLQSNYASLSNWTSNVNSNLQSLSGLVSNLSGNLVSLDSNISGANKQVTSLWSTYSNISLFTNSLSTSISGIQSNVSLLSGNVGSLSNNLSDLGSNYNLLSNRISNVSGTLSALSGNVNTLSGNLSNATSNLNALSGVVSNTNSDINNLSVAASNLRSATSNLSHNILSAQSNIVTMFDDYSLLSADLVNTKNQLSSGYVGAVPYLVTYDWIGKRFAFADQQTNGLNTRLDYGATNYFNICPTSTGTQIIFFNGGIINLANSCTVSVNLDTVAAAYGNMTAGNFYYIYLREATGGTVNLATNWIPAANIYITTTAPDAHYAQLASLSNDKLLIGYMAVTSTNRMSGSYNLWSVYHQATLYWEMNVDGTADMSLPLNGIVIPSANVTFELSRSGVSYGYIAHWIGDTSTVTTAAVGIGHVEAYATIFEVPYCGINLTVSVGSSPSTPYDADYAAHLYHNLYRVEYMPAGCDYATPYYVTGVTGVLRATRTPPAGNILL